MNPTQHLSFVRCDMTQFEALAAMYARSVEKLQRTVNYPKWNDDHPSRAYIEASIRRGEQFVCLGNGEVCGAAVLSEDPEGRYDLVNWSRNLQQGEYLVIHILAVAPGYERTGVGGFLGNQSIAYAKAQGYRAVRLDVLPENLPAIRLYRSRGFMCAGRHELMRNIAGIPMFELYELNLQTRESPR